jgi:hypothetical protein
VPGFICLLFEDWPKSKRIKRQKSCDSEKEEYTPANMGNRYVKMFARLSTQTIKDASWGLFKTCTSTSRASTTTCHGCLGVLPVEGPLIGVQAGSVYYAEIDR